jgi:hypothetical protein
LALIYIFLKQSPTPPNDDQIAAIWEAMEAAQ